MSDAPNQESDVRRPTSFRSITTTVLYRRSSAVSAIECCISDRARSSHC
ncbi:MAG: hypothetical protein WCD53_22405 [Microcoleus sp.]